MTDFYIPSAYKIYPNFDDFKNKKPAGQSLFNHERLVVPDLLQFDKLFLIGEPGYGKSKAMGQIALSLKEAGESYLQLNGKDFRIENLTRDYPVILFDALDESENVLPTFLAVNEFCKDNKIKLIISNRLHYLPRIEAIIINSDFVFIELLAFFPDQIRSFLNNKLSSHGFTSLDFDLIVSNSKGTDGESILRVPRYLNEFVQYVIWNKLTPSEVSSFTRTDLFEKVIYYKLESETKEDKSSNIKYLTKRILERLSLVMEIHCVNRITKEEFITFLDQTDSNISTMLLSAVNLDLLLERVMNGVGEYLQFEHTEFQEYLAAKELVRFGHRHQTVFDLMVQPELGLIKENWLDVLSYAIELEPKFVVPLIAFIKQQKYLVDEQLIRLVISVNPEVLKGVENGKHLSDKIFETCFDYYQAHGLMMRNSNEQLANLLEHGLIKFLKPLYLITDIKAPVFPLVYNQIMVVEALVTKKKLDDEQKKIWGKYLLGVVKIDHLKAIADAAYYAMIAINDAKGLIRNMAFFENKSNELFDKYLRTISKIRPNNQKVIDLILRTISLKRPLKNLKHAVSNLSGKSALIQLFDFLLKNPDHLKAELPGYENEYYSLFDSIKSLNDPTVDSYIKQYVLAGFGQTDYYGHPPKLLLSSLNYLLENGQSIFENLLSKPHFVKSVPEFSDKIAQNLDLNSFKKLELALEPHSWRKTTLYTKVKYGLHNVEENEIVAYINAQKAKESQTQNIEQSGPTKKLMLGQLREYYIEDKSLYNTGLIPFLVNNFDELDSTLLSSDKKYIKEIIGVVLKNYHPEQFNIKIIKSDGSRREFTHNHDSWFSIDLHFKALYLLGDYSQIKKYRIKLLKSLPQMDSGVFKNRDILNEILGIITPLTKADINMLNDYCLSRRDDLLSMNLSSFAQLIRLLKLKELTKVLLKLINDGRAMDYEHEEALKVIGEMADNTSDQQVLRSLFKKHAKKDGNMNLALIANEYLIINFKDEKAIDWRFAELKERLRPFDLDYSWSRARSVSAFESEMDRPTFPICFYGLDSQYIKSKVLDILTFSFDIRTERTQVKYSYYLQEFVFHYYKSIITQNDLNELRNSIQGYKDQNRAGSFNRLLLRLRIELQIRKFRSDTFLNAIHHLNRILGLTYLPINSNEELKELILAIFETEITSLIKDQGFFSVVGTLSGINATDTYSHKEDTIQKTLKIALEKILLEKGFRTVDIYREPQSYDNKRYDFLVKYGLYGPVVIEFKLLNNPEIQNASKREGYKSKLCTYLAANCGIGIYAVFRTKAVKTHQENYDKLISEYADINGLSFNYQDCLVLK